MALIRPDLSRPGYNNVICTEHYLQGRKKACKPVRQETLRDWEKSNVSGHCCKRISYSYDTWNTLFCKGLKEIHEEMVNVTCTGHEHSGCKDSGCKDLGVTAPSARTHTCITLRRPKGSVTQNPNCKSNRDERYMRVTNIRMNSIVVLFNSEACQSLGVIKREASGKALPGLVRRRRAWFFTK